MKHEIEFLKKIDVPYSLGRVGSSGLIIELPQNISFTLRTSAGFQRLTELSAKKRISVTEHQLVEVEKAIASYVDDARDRLRWEDLSSAIQGICRNVEDDLRKEIKRTIAKLRWLSRAFGPLVFLDMPCCTPSLYWRTASSDDFVIIPSPHVIELTAIWHEFQNLDAFQDNSESLFLDHYDDEPLSHELIREARWDGCRPPQTASQCAKVVDMKATQ